MLLSGGPARDRTKEQNYRHSFCVFAAAFGAHQFYIGSKRRGFCSLVLCWTFVAAVLAWNDDFKLAMTDEPAFDRMLASQG